MNGTLKAVVPEGVKRKVKQFISRSVPINANVVVGSLYTPTPLNAVSEQKAVWSRSQPTRRAADEPIPVPPPELTMGYTEDGGDFIRMGQTTATWLRRIMQREGISLGAGKVAAEWGCASGRVMRHFEQEAHECAFWGLDQDGPHLSWAKENMAPPFRFVTCTAYPHLPFEDNHLDFAYGISVFTHLTHLIDMWLMEFRRILKPNGLAIFTIHDENSIQWFHEHPDDVPDWLEGEDLSKGLSDDATVFGGRDWGHTFTCFRSDWVRQEWSQYFDVVSLEPRAEMYHTAVVLRKT